MRNRREFLAASMLSAAGSLLAPGVLATLASEVAEAQEQGASSETDPSAFDFWTKQVRVPRTEAHAFGHAKEPAGEEDRTVEFVYVEPLTGRFLTPGEVDPKILPESGDVTVKVNVHGFRPSDADKDKFSNIEAGTLRIDLQQDKPLHSLLDVMAWTAIGALYPNREGKLPPLGDLKFDPGQTWGKQQLVPLPGGSGSLAFNFFVQKQESFFGKFLRLATGEISKFAPALGLPGIASMALRSFDKVFGYMQEQARTKWILKTPEVKVYATQEAAKEADVSAALPMVSGNYILVPRSQLAQLDSSEWKNFEYMRGWVVPKNTPQKQVYAAAEDTSKELTYVSLNIDVQKVSTKC